MTRLALRPSALHDLIFDSPGYCTALRLLPAELEQLRGWIAERALTHEQVKDKANRLFSPAQVAEIKGYAFLDTVRRQLGAFTLSDVIVGRDIQRGREEVYWRSVRPGAAEDVGPMHRDTEHHARCPGLHGPGETTVKCWIAIETEPGLNGLIVVPNSHARPNTQGTLLPLAPGDMVLFNENLLHQGALNQGKRERVSVEITLVWGKK